MNSDTQRRWQELCNQWEEHGYSLLSRVEKTWLNLRALIDSIENGGIISYFYNYGADTLKDCLEDLQIVGADEVLAQVERVCSLFPNGVPENIEERNEVINSWSETQDETALDELLEQVDQTLMPLMDDLENQLEKHLRQNNLLT